MQARALVCNEQQAFTLADVVLPEPGAGHLVVRASYTGVSIGTEFALIRDKLSWGPYPLCTGYQGIGVVEYAGASAGEFKVGDKVYYRDNKQIAFPDGRPISAVAGTHCSHALIDLADTHGVAPLPVGVDEAAASLFVMPAVGLYGVDMANPRMGQVVVVYGTGLIGLGVVAACRHRGCEVIAIDLDSKRLGLATKLGADHIIDASAEDVAAGVHGIAPEGADVVFESTGIPACIDTAISLCKARGTFVWQGNYGAAPVTMHFLPPHSRHLTMFFPCDDGLAPCRTAVFRNMAMGFLPWHVTVTHRVPADASAQLFDDINHGRAPDIIGAVICWS